MKRRIGVFLIGILCCGVMCGCVALLAGAAGGAGTAVWLSGKLSQEVNSPYEETIKAAKSALRSLKFEITKETKEIDVCQIMSKYSDGKTIWIDIRPVTQARSKIDVRVGAVRGDREGAEKILNRITRYL